MVKAYEPFKLPIDDLVNINEFIKELLEANKLIGVYQVLLNKSKINPELLLTPNFFISESLQKDKFKYYKLLNDTRIETSNEDEKSKMIASQRWNTWIKFFITAIINQANQNMKLIEKIDELYNITIDESRKIINSNKLIDIVNVMFKRPVFTKKRILEMVDIPKITVVFL